MAGALPGIVIRIAAQTKDAIDGLNKVNQALGSAANQSAKTSAQWQAIGKGIKGIAVGAAAAIGFDRVTDAIGQSINAASSLNEALGKNSAVFGLNARNVERWSETTLKDFRINQTAALDAAATYANLGEAFGVADEKAAQMSMRMVEHAADLAAFSDTSIEDALAAIQSGLSGEMEPLKRYGVALLDTRVKQEALNQGLWDGKGALDTAAKFQASYSLILKDSKNAIGTANREQNSYAMTMKALTGATQQAQVTVGKEFLEAVQTTSAALGGPDGMIDGIASLADGAANAVAPIGAVAEAIATVNNAAEVATGGFAGLGDLLGGFARVTSPLTMAWIDWGGNIREAREESERFSNHLIDVKNNLINLARQKGLIPETANAVAGIGTEAQKAKSDVDRLKGALDTLYGKNQTREQQRIELKRMRQQGPAKSGSRTVADPKNPETVLDPFGIPHMVPGSKKTSFTTEDDARLFAIEYAQKIGEYAQTVKASERAGVLQGGQNYIAKIVAPYVNRPQRFASSLIGAPEYLTNPRPWEGMYAPGFQGGTSTYIDKVIVQGDTPAEVMRKLKDWERYKASSPAGNLSLADRATYASGAGLR